MKEQLADFSNVVEIMSKLLIQAKYLQAFIDALHSFKQDLGVIPALDRQQLGVVGNHVELRSSGFPAADKYAEARELQLALRHDLTKRYLVFGVAAYIIRWCFHFACTLKSASAHDNASLV